MSGLRGDLSRKLLHIAMGGFAFLLRYLTWWQAALLAIVALLNNLLVMPRVGRKRFFRGEAKERGLDVGIVLYAASVLVLILVFPHRLDLVAAAWAFLAFGDGLATIAGLAFGRASGPLPWNAQKTWAGFTGFVVAAGRSPPRSRSSSSPSAWCWRCWRASTPGSTTTCWCRWPRAACSTRSS